MALKAKRHPHPRAHPGKAAIGIRGSQQDALDGELPGDRESGVRFGGPTACARAGEKHIRRTAVADERCHCSWLVHRFGKSVCINTIISSILMRRHPTGCA